MDWLNYHHLHYFWTVAREGSVTRASRRLRLAPSTVSAQVRMLEDELGAELFVRSGRRLELTPAGRTAWKYAEQIFALGRELSDSLHAAPSAPVRPLVVGLADVVPKLIAYQLLSPALGRPDPVRLVCREGRPDRLAAELQLGDLDLAVTDAPASGDGLTSELLGDSGVSFFGSAELARPRREGFPASLHRAPFVLPLDETAPRREIERWLESVGARPQVVGEFEDGALLQVFAQAGHGIFAAATAIEEQVVAQFGVEVIGRVEEIRVRFYAVTAQREAHPAVREVVEEARRQFSRRGRWCARRSLGKEEASLKPCGRTPLGWRHPSGRAEPAAGSESCVGRGDPPGEA